MMSSGWGIGSGPVSPRRLRRFRASSQPVVYSIAPEGGSDRVLFSVDYPYETMQEQSDWRYNIGQE
jgi:predicted TIM-barrel fold metal-dependent hydrolase